MMKTGLRLLTATLVMGVGSGVAAQERGTLDPGRVFMTRPALEELLETWEAAARSRGYSEALREIARDEAAAIRLRLDRGDFQAGDRIFVQVDNVQTIADTFQVNQDVALPLPEIGAVSLEGVLRAELNDHMRREIARFVRDPSVQTTSVIRLTVSGGTGGFYTFPAQQPITDVLQSIGGLPQGRIVDDIRIARGEVIIYEGARMQQAVASARTLDQMNLRPGDQILLPSATGALGGGGGEFIRTVSVLLSIPFSLIGLLNIL